MKHDIQMTAAARDGYEGGNNKHLFSSALWMAHKVGEDMARRKMRSPCSVSMSRGFSVNVKSVSGAKFVATFGRPDLIGLVFIAKD